MKTDIEIGNIHIFFFHKKKTNYDAYVYVYNRYNAYILNNLFDVRVVSTL